MVDLQPWLARVAQALAEASAYNDRKEVICFLQVSEPEQTFESREDPGPARVHNLDAMLSGALQSELKGGDLAREVTTKLSSLIKDRKLHSGRQVAQMICRSLRLNEKNVDSKQQNGSMQRKVVGGQL